MVAVNCDLCGGASHDLVYEISVSEHNPRFYRYARNVPDKERFTGVYQIVKCTECDLVYTNPRFTTEELEVVYSSEKIIGGVYRNFDYLFDANAPDILRATEKGVTFDPKMYQWKFDIIQKYCIENPSKLRLLDVGCGDGRFVFDALQRGYQVTGIDLSPDRVEQGMERYQFEAGTLRCMNVDEFSAGEKFDIVVMWDLIEHVESPSAVMKNLQKIAHDDTVFFILTMSLDSLTYKLFKRDWYYINPTQHLHYFSHSTMPKILKKNELEQMGVELDDSRYKNLLHLIRRIIIGRINRFFFYVYTRKSFLRYIFKPFLKGISEERILKRLENIYPGKYLGRYRDNFVFVARKKR